MPFIIAVTVMVLIFLFYLFMMRVGFGLLLIGGGSLGIYHFLAQYPYLINNSWHEFSYCAILTFAIVVMGIASITGKASE